MKFAQTLTAVLLSGVLVGSIVAAQDAPLFNNDFPAEEFIARRQALYDAIGVDGLALVQGAPTPVGYVRFRQSNEFYYLCGLETPHAYLLLDGASRRTSLYLPDRDDRRERTEGKILTAEDVELIRKLTGVDEVHETDRLSDHLARYAHTGSPPTLYTPYQPAEGVATSRDLGRRAANDIANDPWDGRPSREKHLVNLIHERFPGIEVADLSPILDQMRLLKSPREIELIRKSTRLAGLAIMEAMRSTEPGLMEYELDGVAKFIYFRNGAQADAYYSLIASGPNAWFPHYHAGKRRLRDGELVLMDYAPDYGYYSSDVTRQWPVNGHFNGWQRELYGFYLATYKAILDHIRPGDVQPVKQAVGNEMQQILERWNFSKPYYRESASRFVDAYVRSAGRPGGSLGHGVGMAVHDVGDSDGVLAPGMVFTIEPQFRVPEEKLYLRLEDMILITEDGAENLSGFLPMEMDEIEALIAEDGLLQRYPRATWKD
ncbi:MAG: aminopeptidase P N-terminal domain-containing protein [Acidobacteriota bacterium]